ncbi:hypothetical protein B0I35DRAFT_12210 [Stachybotrys elegans]|uniref:Myb-like domain-containing protein n=1 Tax=Stachybotrys elegans TaxID=80388 RepID=A0A8K0T0D9_9HYPO|nr:hypothetical protein B0I35DRAFT_12210 [Stachybotrys elegans]
MAAFNDTPEKGEGKSGAWTDTAKLQFLLRIIGQLAPQGKGIDWKRIQMPGRTTKSLQMMWTKIRKEISEIEEQQAETTTPVATPRKRNSEYLAPLVTCDNFLDLSGMQTPIKKRSGSESPVLHSIKRVKKEETDEY